MTSIIYARTNQTIITKISVLISWNLKQKMRILVNHCFQTFEQKSMIEFSLLSCLIKGMPFSFISIACPIQMAIYQYQQNLAMFYTSNVSEILGIVWKTTDLGDMVKRFNLLLIRNEKKSNEFVCIILLLEKIFGKHLTYFIGLQIQLTN